MQMALKSADLGHLTSQTDVHCTWVSRLEEVSSSWGEAGRCMLGLEGYHVLR